MSTGTDEHCSLCDQQGVPDNHRHGTIAYPLSRTTLLGWKCVDCGMFVMDGSACVCYKMLDTIRETSVST